MTHFCYAARIFFEVIAETIQSMTLRNWKWAEKVKSRLIDCSGYHPDRLGIFQSSAEHSDRNSKNCLEKYPQM